MRLILLSVVVFLHAVTAADDDTKKVMVDIDGSVRIWTVLCRALDIVIDETAAREILSSVPQEHAANLQAIYNVLKDVPAARIETKIASAKHEKGTEPMKVVCRLFQAKEE